MTVRNEARDRIPAGFFITGTDTGVGKTEVTAALAYELRRHGIAVAAMKPVASGCEPTPEGLRNSDALKLQAQCSVATDYERINPYAFAPPIAPHIAARDCGVEIDLGRLEHKFRDLAAGADCVLVEGVGGFEVPLGEVETTADLAQRLDLPIILVVGMRLGCINHTLLTAAAIARRGLTCAGWVANCVDPDMARVQENIDELRLRLAAPLLGVVPRLPEVTAEQLAPFLDLGALQQGVA